MHVYCLFAVSTMSFSVLYVLRTLGYVKWWTECIASSRASLVLLGTIMVVMKAHLSPSQLHLIPHNWIAVALEWGWVFVWSKGSSCVCAWEWMFETQSCWPVDEPVWFVEHCSIGLYLMIVKCYAENWIDMQRLHFEIVLRQCDKVHVAFVTTPPHTAR